MSSTLDPHALLQPALTEARKGFAEGNMPCGGAVFDASGTLLGAGHNLARTHDDPLIHGETAAFAACHFSGEGDKSDLTFVTTLSPCWYCAGLIRWFGFKRLIIGDSTTFEVAEQWLADSGIEVIALNDPECRALLAEYIALNPDDWEWPGEWLPTTPEASALTGGGAGV